MVKHSKKDHLCSIDDLEELKRLVDVQYDILNSIRDVMVKNDSIANSIESTMTVLRHIILTTDETQSLQSKVDSLRSQVPLDGSRNVIKEDPTLIIGLDKLVKKLMVIMQNILKYENSEKLPSSQKPIKEIDPVKTLKQLQVGSID